MSEKEPRTDVAADGSLILDRPVELPQVLDLLIVGAGPSGTAAAFRARELGLRTLVIDKDDVLTGIRDFADGKTVSPDYQGDEAVFPDGGPLVQSLRFEEVDKDQLYAQWKALYRQHSVPARLGVEFTDLRPVDDQWDVVTWNHNLGTEQVFRAKHVVLSLGCGHPREIDIPGMTPGLAYKLRNATDYVGDPACVIGGGTSALEAVNAIASAKVAAKDQTSVYWSYRGRQMANINLAVGARFLAPFFVGKIEYLPRTEPYAFIEVNGESILLLTRSRVATDGVPPEQTLLEFKKRFCVACIGADIPEALLRKIGLPLLQARDSGRKALAVTSALETRHRNVHLAGDLLQSEYIETNDFTDPSQFREITRRKNIKSAIRDGVIVAQVVADKLAGRTQFDIDVAVAKLPVALAVDPRVSPFRLTRLMADGSSFNEYSLNCGITTVGRKGDLAFPNDALLADVHAEVIADQNGCAVINKQRIGVFVLPQPNRAVEIHAETLILAGRQWFKFGDPATDRSVSHLDATTQTRRSYTIQDGKDLIFGRQSPDMTIAADDPSLSRRHFAVSLESHRFLLYDLGGANGTRIFVNHRFPVQHEDCIAVGGQVFRVADERLITRAGTRVQVDNTAVVFPNPPTVHLAAAAPMPASGTPQQIPAAVVEAVPKVIFVDGPQVTCVHGQSILEVADEAGVPISNSCGRVGSCGECVVRILDGFANITELEDKERKKLQREKREPGPFRLACRAKIKGPVKVSVLTGE